MSRKLDFSKKIVSLLAQKPAISLTELTEALGATGTRKYALSRSLKGLIDSGIIESHHSGQNDYARLTTQGKKRANSLKLENDTALVNPNWDGKWRIILLDLPEERKSERDSLRYLLKKAGFMLLKNSVWVSPFPFEHLFINIKKDLELTTELMIFVTDTIDSETEKEIFNLAK
jgi:phenylacetic acid degradation operon negative regulatory protein